jgi:hypothetical protein
MDSLTKTIRKLSEEDFTSLLDEVAPSKSSKPYIVLTTVKQQDLSDSQMIEKLGVNPSTYYTLKSRLNSKVAAVLSKKVDNPIRVLLDEVTRVPAILYGSNKQIATRVLKELEKQLLEYDLSNELIIVYKTLARLHMYSPEFETYNKLYNKYVAFSLAGAKAENLFYDFILRTGIYELSRKEEDLELVQSIMREMNNICELYDSHRLYVLYNIMRIYYLCEVAETPESLLSKEIEIDEILQKIRGIFEKYSLDTMYSNFKYLVDILYFVFYQKAGHPIRARHYFNKVNEHIPEMSEQFILSFHVTQFLNAKLNLYLQTGAIELLTDLNDQLQDTFDIDKDELYQYVSYQRFMAASYFYSGDYPASARTLNNLRNNTSLKSFWHVDVELRLFQALQYSIMGEEELCLQITNSISRHIREDKGQYKNIQLFIKLLKAGFKMSEDNKKVRKIGQIWQQFLESNKGPQAILPYLKLDEKMIRKMAGH